MKSAKMKFLSIILCCMLLMGALVSCGSGGDSSASGGGSGSASSEVISEAEAKAIALGRVQGASEADITKFSMEDDDGHYIYEGEIVYKGIEYDFEIEGCTGNVLSWEMEKFN